MFAKRKSMLGRRHLMAQQQAKSRPSQSQSQGSGDGSYTNQRSGSSWRGRRSERTKTPNHKDSKKCLFTNSPGYYLGSYRTQGQERIHYSSNENLLNETGITCIVPTPSSTPRNRITPATLHQRRIDMEKVRYGPLPSTARSEPNTVHEPDRLTSSSGILHNQTSFTYDFDNLKPPDSPGPSRLDRILLEERLAQSSSSKNVYSLEPPKSPGPSRLDKLIMEEKLEQPSEPDIRKMENLNLDDARTCMGTQFSPPLSSTCIGSPDSGKKTSTANEQTKESALGSGRKLSVIKEDCDVSVIEFEINERTLCEFENTLIDTTVNNTIKPNKPEHLENIVEERSPESADELKPTWENIFFCLEKMENDVLNRAARHANEIRILKEQMELTQSKIEKESVDDINKIRKIKKTLEILKQKNQVVCSIEDKENDFTFRVPTCKKNQLDDESKWFNSVKKENPGLLKTPNPSRKITQSDILTPHSLSNVLHDQMNELYK